MNGHSISIVMPLYNEEENAEKAVIRNIETVSAFTSDYEVILVNDASIDSTLQIIKDKFSHSQGIVLVNREKNGGFGAAVKSGIDIATKDHIICAPADSPLDLDTFADFYAGIGKADIIVSYRRERKGYNRLMKINARFYHWLISRLFDMNLKDYNWIHLYARKVFDSSGIVIQNNGIFMLAEVLIKARRKGFTFYEIPVNQKQRIAGTATAAQWRIMFKTLGELLRFYFNDMPDARK